DPYRTDRVPDRSCQQRLRAEWDLTFQAVRGEQPTRVVLHLERFPVTNVVGDQQITSLVLEFDPPIVEHGTLLVTGLRRETNDELPRSAVPDQLREDVAIPCQFYRRLRTGIRLLYLAGRSIVRSEVGNSSRHRKDVVLCCDGVHGVREFFRGRHVRDVDS